ncbi:hypothetical protein UNDKW_4041 [Undibacterium sp. KW1]|nr:hypothetical protein UNDKW_4041 [Undibacterium sp. KW1]
MRINTVDKAIGFIIGATLNTIVRTFFPFHQLGKHISLGTNSHIIDTYLISKDSRRSQISCFIVRISSNTTICTNLETKTTDCIV